jgi:hypothetical protein
MTLAVRNLVIQDDDGNLMAGASIEVRLDVQGKPLARIYSDRAGLNELPNPFETDDGKASFFALGGAYQIKATLGDFEDIQNYVPVGRGAETDISLTNPRGTWSNAVTYAKGDLVTHTGTAGMRSFISLQDTNLNHAPDADTPIVDTAWWMLSPGTTTEQAQAILDGATTQAGVATTQAGIATAQKVLAAAEAANAALSAASAASSSVSPALRYLFDTGLSGVGLLTTEFRTNNATLASVTKLYVHDNAVQGAVAAYLNTIFSGSSPTKGHILGVNPQDEQQFFIFKCTSVIDQSGYTEFTGTMDASAGAWVDGASFVLQFLKTGDQGAGDMTAAQNLNDVASKPTAFANIKQDASTTATGVVELATLAESNANTDALRAVTPSSLVNRLKSDLENQGPITGGASITVKALTNPTNGSTLSIDASNRPIQSFTNNVAGFTLAADSADGACTIYITNGASAGTITLSGITRLGDNFTTTNGHVFRVLYERVNGVSRIYVKALQ